VHLIGGGATTGADAPLYAPFVAEAALRAGHAGRARPRIAVISLHPEAEEKAAALGELLTEAGTGHTLELHLTAGRPGGPIELDAIADVDGIAVGGGNVENVRAGLEPVFGELRRLVAGGVPYLGVSAGAMIAAEGSLGSGSRIGGVVVSPEDPGEAGDELEIEAGIGLVDVAIEVHVAERGMLSRLVAAVESGLVAGGLGVPRPPAEIQGGGGEDVLDGTAEVRTRAGDDVTAAFLRGSRGALEAAVAGGARLAVLKEGSPSCGSGFVYDGTFSGARREGRGVTAALLERHGIRVFSDLRIDDAAAYLRSLEGER